jgi:hypothetical protein
MNGYQILNVKKELEAVYRQLLVEVDSIQLKMIDCESFEKFIASLNNLIDVNRSVLAVRSKNLSARMDSNKLTAEQYDKFNQAINFNEDQYNMLRSKFTSLISFEFPVLELFPGKGTFTTEAVAGEPLYIADYHMSTMEKVGKRFNDFYNQKRLMKYEIKDFDLSALPQNQFGLVFSYCYFMVKDIDFITNWAKEVLKLLRPGGHFVFNFIPDDNESGLQTADQNLVSAINHNVLEQNLINIGYEIVNKTLYYGYSSTLQIKKPGELKTFKLSSSLAKIIEKTEPLV